MSSMRRSEFMEHVMFHRKMSEPAIAAVMTRWDESDEAGRKSLEAEYSQPPAPPVASLPSPALDELVTPAAPAATITTSNNKAIVRGRGKATK